jgi:hypothetical protein
MTRATIHGINKICNVCLISQHKQNFYTLTRGGHLSKCKKCFNNIKRLKYVHKNRTPRTIPDTQKAILLREVKEGYNMKQIAQRNNLTYYTVRRYNKINPFVLQILQE